MVQASRKINISSVHIFNPYTQEAKAKGSQVQRQPGLHSKTPLQRKLKQKQRKRHIVPLYNHKSAVNNTVHCKKNVALIVNKKLTGQ